MAAWGRPLSLLTVLIGPTLLAVGSVYGLHVLARYAEEAQRAPDAAARDIVVRTMLALRRALDQELADFDSPLDGVREVAFFPPMTGG